MLISIAAVIGDWIWLDWLEHRKRLGKNRLNPARVFGWETRQRWVLRSIFSPKAIDVRIYLSCGEHTTQFTATFCLNPWGGWGKHIFQQLFGQHDQALDLVNQLSWTSQKMAQTWKSHAEMVWYDNILGPCWVHVGPILGHVEPKFGNLADCRPLSRDIGTASMDSRIMLPQTIWHLWIAIKLLQNRMATNLQRRSGGWLQGDQQDDGWCWELVLELESLHGKAGRGKKDNSKS